MPVVAVQSTTKNTCPHGLPPGACPICNGGGGGGRIQRHHSKSVRNRGDWSYAKCYAAWQKMLAQRAERQSEILKLNNKTLDVKPVQNKINDIMSKLTDVAKNAVNVLPDGVKTVFAKIFNAVTTPFLKFINNLPEMMKNLQNILRDIKAQIFEVSEKLTALFGEIKNFIDRKIVRNFKKLAKSLKSLFGWDDEEEFYMNDDKLRVFGSRELSKIRHALISVTKEGAVKNDNTVKLR